jgi:hypothetical protein
MTSLEVALRRVTDDLRTRGARFALVGGLADVDRARSALARIRELGFHRNRDFARALDD